MRFSRTMLRDIWENIALPAPARPDPAWDDDRFSRAFLKARGIPARQVDIFFDKYEMDRRHIINLFGKQPPDLAHTILRWAARGSLASTMAIASAMPGLSYPNNVAGGIALVIAAGVAVAIRNLYFFTKDANAGIACTQFNGMVYTAGRGASRDIFIRKLRDLNPDRAAVNKKFTRTINARPLKNAA